MRTSFLKKVWFTVALFDFLRVSVGRLCLAKDAWTEEEVKQIIHFLKQRGRWHAVTRLGSFTLIPVRRDEGFHHGVCGCAPNLDRPSPPCIWYIPGKCIGFLANLRWISMNCKVQRAAAEMSQDPTVLPKGRHLPSVSVVPDVLFAGITTSLLR